MRRVYADEPRLLRVERDVPAVLGYREGGTLPHEPLGDAHRHRAGDAGHRAHARDDGRVAHAPDDLRIPRGCRIGVVGHPEERVLRDLRLYGRSGLEHGVVGGALQAVVAEDRQDALPVFEAEPHSSSWMAFTEQALMQDPQAIQVSVFSLISSSSV